MSIHAIDFAAAANTDSYLVDSYIPQWLTTHAAWADPRQDNAPPTLVAGTDENTPDHYRGGPWRFAWAASKSVLLDTFVGYTQSYAGDWWRIRWHECRHDGVGDCTWTDIQSGGTVPGGI